MKRLACITIAAALATSVALVGCGQATPPKTETKPAENKTTEQVVGGWTAYDGTTPSVTDEERQVFDQAVVSEEGARYEPVRVLATQVVSGTNYAYLARGTTNTAEPAASWYVVVVYQDLSGNVSLASAKPIDLADTKTTNETTSTNMVGGWEVRDPANSVLEPKEAADAFDKAAESYADIALRPVATLGSQVVAGANYLMLCSGTPAGGNARTQLYLATVYVNPQHEATITDVRGFDLLAYVG